MRSREEGFAITSRIRDLVPNGTQPDAIDDNGQKKSQFCLRVQEFRKILIGPKSHQKVKNGKKKSQFSPKDPNFAFLITFRVPNLKSCIAWPGDKFT